MYSTVGWSNLLLFEILENGHIAADQVYFLIFMSSIPKNGRRNFFYFKKITWTIQINIFFNLQYLPFMYIIEHLPKRKCEIKKFYILF